jgi:hypothetical protein
MQLEMSTFLNFKTVSNGSLRHPGEEQWIIIGSDWFSFKHCKRVGAAEELFGCNKFLGRKRCSFSSFVLQNFEDLFTFKLNGDTGIMNNYEVDITQGFCPKAGFPSAVGLSVRKNYEIY